MIIKEFFKEDIESGENVETSSFSIILLKTLTENNYVEVCTIVFFEKQINLKDLWKSSLKEFCFQNDFTLHSIIVYESKDQFKIAKQFLKLIRIYNPPVFSNFKVSQKLNSYEKILINNSYKLDTNIDKSLKKSNLISLDNLHTLPQSKGIYFIYNTKNELMYVGKSINIRKRIYSHIHDEYSDWKHNFAKMKFIKLSNLNDKELNDYETYFINEEKPPLNLAKVYTYKSERYSPKYNKQINNFQNLRHYIKYLVGKELIVECFNLNKLIEEKQKELDSLKELLL